MRIVRPITVTDSVLAFSSVAENDYTAWNSGTTYAAGARVRRVLSNYHKVFESAVAGNVGHDPQLDADGAYWLEVGETNRWAMFDGAVQSQTTDADSLVVTLTPGPTERVDTIALLNIAAATAHILMTDGTDGVVYDQTHSLISDSGISDWGSYFFEPIERLRDLVVADLPPYAGASIAITLLAIGETVACGALVLGFAKDIGGTQYGATLGITDYSRKETDEFGSVSVVERAYSRTASFDVIVANSYVDQLHTLLANYRAVPTLYIGSDNFAATAVWGFFRSFGVTIAYPDRSICSLEVESLV